MNTCSFQIKSILYPEADQLQPSSTLKKEVYLRHSQRQYNSNQPPRQHELSSTFSTGTLNTQISADNTSPSSSPTKSKNLHPVLQDTLSGSSVISYPAGYLSSPVFSSIIATQDEPISADIDDVIIREERNGNHRDSGLGDEAENPDITMEAELRSEDDVMKNGIVEESLTESPSVTPKSFDVMLQE